MKTDETKELLDAYQMGQEVPPNSKLFQAIELLKVNPQLARWYYERQILDANLKAAFSKLREVPSVKDSCLKAIS